MLTDEFVRGIDRLLDLTGKTADPAAAPANDT